MKKNKQPSTLSLMKVTDKHNERIANMTFASVYPHYVTKVEKKGRSVEELHQVIVWLTGFDENRIQELKCRSKSLPGSGDLQSIRNQPTSFDRRTRTGMPAEYAHAVPIQPCLPAEAGSSIQLFF